MTHPEMTCQELVEAVTDYLEGRLPRTERARLERHLVDCDGCDEYLTQMRLTVQALASLRGDDLAPDAKERLLRAFRASRPD